MQNILEGITYTVLSDTEEIKHYVVEACKAQRTERDYPIYWEDLFGSTRVLEEVLLSDIAVDRSLLEREEFQEAMKPRVQKQQDLLDAQIAIPPLILRGKDLRIFDGYARYHFFIKQGIKNCLAYVWHRNAS